MHWAHRQALQEPGNDLDDFTGWYQGDGLVSCGPVKPFETLFFFFWLRPISTNVTRLDLTLHRSIEKARCCRSSLTQFDASRRWVSANGKPHLNASLLGPTLNAISHATSTVRSHLFHHTTRILLGRVTNMQGFEWLLWLIAFGRRSLEFFYLFFSPCDVPSSCAGGYMYGGPCHILKAVSNPLEWIQQ